MQDLKAKPLLPSTLLNWLLEGDVSIQYQTKRDLLDSEEPELQKRIEIEGWGAAFLAQRNQNGHWGLGFYQPKWISTHYTLLDLKNLNITPSEPIRESIDLILRTEKGEDGGVNPGKTISASDVCINGMFLNYACYFGAQQESLKSIVDFLLSQQMPDRGFNCRSNRSGAVHSSLHTTLSVAEGILEYGRYGYQYRLAELQKAERECREFILQHRLFKSDKTGKTIDSRFLALSYPCRWRYDILRALDYFHYAGVAYDERMADAIDALLRKRRKDNTWPLQAKHPGKTHFDMEKPGTPGRWNTLRASRVLKFFNVL